MPYNPITREITRDYRLDTASDARSGDPITQAQLDRVADDLVSSLNDRLQGDTNLGPMESDPLPGDPRNIEGAIYVNTTVPELRIYSAANGWTSISDTSEIARQYMEQAGQFAADASASRVSASNAAGDAEISRVAAAQASLDAAASAIEATNQAQVAATHALETGEQISALSTQVNRAAVYADETESNASASESSRQNAEVAMGAAQVARDQSVQARDTAEGHAASASATLAATVTARNEAQAQAQLALQAKNDIDGTLSASLVMRVDAGNPAQLELVSASNPTGPAESVAKLTADLIEVQTDLTLFGGALQSSNYQVGQQGWRIEENGDAEFNTVLIRKSNGASAVSAIESGAIGVQETLSTSFGDLNKTLNDNDVFIIESRTFAAGKFGEFRVSNNRTENMIFLKPYIKISGHDNIGAGDVPEKYCRFYFEVRHQGTWYTIWRGEYRQPEVLGNGQFITLQPFITDFEPSTVFHQSRKKARNPLLDTFRGNNTVVDPNEPAQNPQDWTGIRFVAEAFTNDVGIVDSYLTLEQFNRI